jgi:hypothetical protein
MRDLILSEIKRLAAENAGRAPGVLAFERETGIGAHAWRGKMWARWSDALAEAGLQPNSWNEKLDSEHVMLGFIAASRHYGRLATRDEINLYRQSDPTVPSTKAIETHFGTRAQLIEALAKKVEEDLEFADLLPMLPKTTGPKHIGTRVAEGFVYLLKSGNYYKIGRSDDIERRVKQITVALPDKTNLVHSIKTDDPPGIEAYWHRRFAEKRANGEWFKLTSSDVAAFKKRKFQ